jgi:tRNA 2-thiocytidine biosynthesis protein TtcA
LKRILSLMRSAVQDYDMIAPGDRIAVGLSGGKDSLVLLTALARLREFYPVPFELAAVTIDTGTVSGGHDIHAFDGPAALCASLGVPYYIESTDINRVVFGVRNEKNPCSLCARLRRGALDRVAREHGCSKVALGHHLDDAVETFVMNILHGSRLGCFSPITEMSRSGVTVIRPLIYLTEGEIRGAARRCSLPVVANPCPVNGGTERARVKEYLKSLEHEHRGIRRRIFTAIRSSHIDGW